jgi:CheY-like chemotaxis protein
MNSQETLRILCVCDDDAIRFLREPMLQEAGYQVKWLPSNAAFDVAAIRSYDVAIICQSVPWRRAAHVAAFLRRSNPLIRTLRVNTLRSEMENGFYVDCEVIAGPGLLIQVLDTLQKKLSESCVIGQQLSMGLQSKLSANRAVLIN